MALSSERAFFRISYRLLGKHVLKYLPYSDKLEKIYRKSGLLISYEAYVSLCSFISVICLISSFTAILVAKYFFNVTFNVQLFLLVPLASFLAVISMLALYPIFFRLYVKGKIEDQLFLTTNLFYVVSSAGLTIEETLKKTSKLVNEKYTKNYLDRIVRNMDVFGMGVDDALSETLERTPSKKLASILSNMVYASKTTGNPVSYLESEVNKLRLEKRRDLEKKISSLTFFGEIYIALLVVFPVTIILVLSTLSVLGGAFMGLPTTALLNLVVFLLTPILAVSLAVLLDALIGSW